MQAIVTLIAKIVASSKVVFVTYRFCLKYPIQSLISQEEYKLCCMSFVPKMLSSLKNLIVQLLVLFMS